MTTYDTLCFVKKGRERWWRRKEGRRVAAGVKQNGGTTFVFFPRENILGEVMKEKRRKRDMNRREERLTRGESKWRWKK